MQDITRLQIETMDQIMDAGEEQIKAPNPMTRAPEAMLSKLRSLPGLPAGTWPSSDAFPMGPMNPFQFWTQLAEWQKASAEAMAFWVKGGRPADAGGLRRR